MLCGKSGEAGIPGEHLGVGDRERSGNRSGLMLVQSLCLPSCGQDHPSPPFGVPWFCVSFCLFISTLHMVSCWI